MYEQFYNLRERPFALSPDPDYLYLSHPHGETLDSLRYGIESLSGFIVITGEIGAGKTTLLQTLLGRIDERITVARLVNTTLDPRELLEAILLDFGLQTAGKTKPVMLRDFGQFLIQQRQEGKRALLVIDEAQNLSPAALEEIRLLSNFETAKSKLLQILLAGQPDLRHTLAQPGLEQFRQRIAVSYHLRPLDANDTAGFINARLAHAALGVPLRFPRDASDEVYRRSGGLPRLINVICDATLVFGYAEERRSIDTALVREVIAELELTGVMAGALKEAPAQAAPAQAAPAQAAPAQAAPAAAPASSASTRSSTAAAPPRTREDIARPAVGRPAAATVPRVGTPDRVSPARPQEAAERKAAFAERASALAQREEAVARRERQLAHERRVLEDPMRLRRSPQLAAAPRGTETPRVLAPPPVAVRFDTTSEPQPLKWLRRLFGIG